MKLHGPVAPAGGSSVTIDPAEQGHNDLIGQPPEQFQEGPVARGRGGAAAISTEEHTAEDYILVPRIIGRAVKVPALVTVVAVLIGGALLGIIGALVAMSAAAAILLITREILIPRLDEA